MEKQFKPYNAYIVAATRTPGARQNGVLKEWHPISLMAHTIDDLMQKNVSKDKYHLVDDVIVGCVMQIGEQANNLGRNVVLASKTLSEATPGTAIDRQCGSSQQSVHFAAQAVMSGTQDIVLAAGVESMTRVPIGANVYDAIKAGHGMPMSQELYKKYGDRLTERGLTMFSQFEGAELLAEKYNLTREQMEEFSVSSHKKAHEATEKGYFNKELTLIKGQDKQGGQVIHSKDEGIRPNTNLESLKKLKDLKSIQSKGRKKGIITAGLASQICDGAACMMICNENGLKKLGLKPRAKIISMAVVGSDPVIMLEGPIPATRKALNQVNLTINDMNIYEVNEAFACVPMAWAKELKADYKKLNVNGGAMALGHPLGGTGCKIMTTMLYEMERRNLKYGLQAICEGGGTANATIIELIDQGNENLKPKL